MSFDWSEYFNLARELADLGEVHVCQEAESRSAISRAYYAAFCTSRYHLFCIDGKKRSSRDYSHYEVPERFIAHGDTSGDIRYTRIGTSLQELRRLRNQADYDDSFKQLSKNTRWALEITADILSDLRELRKNSPIV